MRDYVLNQAIALEEAGHWTIGRVIRYWRERKSVGKLKNLDNYVLADIGYYREDVEWASGLPLTVSAAIALEERTRQRQPNS